MVMYSIDAGVLGDEPLQPMFSAPYQIHKADWGAASPDAVYRRAWIRDDLPYRLHGQLGNAECLLIEFRRATPPTLLNRDDLAPEPDGTFELFLGGAERSSNWMPIASGTVGLSVREFFGDWMQARRSRLRIDCLDGGLAPRPDANARRVAAAFDLSADWIFGAAVAFWAERSRQLAESCRNTFSSRAVEDGIEASERHASLVGSRRRRSAGDRARRSARASSGVSNWRLRCGARSST